MQSTKSKTEPAKLKSASEVIAALRKRYDPPAWVLLENVSNGTGGAARRWSDALAMSVWPSRGLHVHGFEVKVSRNDLVRELKNPEKAEEVARYCDFWWIAVGDASIAKAEELPATWGLLVPMTIKGEVVSMRVMKEATPLVPQAIDRPFLAAVLRRTAELFDVQRIRESVRGEVYSEIAERVQKSSEDLHAMEIANLRTRAEKAECGMVEARTQLQTALGHGFSPDVLQRAIRLLDRLSNWNGAEKTIGRVMSLIDQQAIGLSATRETMKEALELVETIQNKEPAIDGAARLGEAG